MNKTIMETIVATLITGLFTLLVSSTLQFFINEKLKIEISESIKNSNGLYLTNVNVINYKRTDIKNTTMVVPSSIEVNNIITNIALLVEKEASNIGTQYSSTFNILTLPASTKFSFLIETPTKLDIEHLNFSNLTDGIKVKRVTDLDNPFLETLLDFLLYSIMFSIYFGCTMYFSKKITQHHKQKVQDEIDKAHEEVDITFKKAKEETNKASVMVDEYEKKYESIEKQLQNLKKQMLLYRAKLYDYSKELNFWRNTIRKLMYKSEHSELNSEIIFKEVTKQLKTYSTNKNVEFDYEALKVVSNLVKEE